MQNHFTRLLMEFSKEKVECIDQKKCKWKGTMDQVHTDRGGHNFLCPKCGKQVKSRK